ncbi:MAG TPA: hypothetical protein VK447_16480 [Myxococcaceae bacterium]|nr:hypothetical protein [Myxococcaceae bacterium]
MTLRIAFTGLAALWLLHAPPVWARDAGDGGVIIHVPDASVGQGGADQGQEDDEGGTGQVASFCRTSQDCSKGFGCKGSRCVYVGYRNAEEGCLLGVNATTGALMGLVLIGARGLRRRRR